MVKITIKDVKQFKESIKAISNFVAEGSLVINKEGLKMTAMDPANVAMILFSMDKAGLIDNDATEDTKVKFNLTSLKQVLARLDNFSLEFKDNIKITGKGKHGTKAFELPLIADDDKEIRNMPELTFAAKVDLSTDQFSESLEDAGIVAESCALVCKAGTFAVLAKGDTQEAVSEVTGAKVNTKEEIMSKYALEYLTKVMGAGKLADNMTINYGKNYPVRFDFKKDSIAINIIVAPRVEND